MNTLFIIGNGFDINLGMKTRYSDFYEYYQKKETKSDNIKNLKKNISEDIDNWSDLELALGKYTKNNNSLEELDEIIDDIGDNLAEYLKQVEANYDFEKINKGEFYECLSHPENYLLKADRDKVIAFHSRWYNTQPWSVNIMSFNYTTTIEKIIGENFIDTIIGTINNNQIILKHIEHIHGFIDERMIMGVNDISQISNVSFCKNQDIIEALVKSESNKAYKYNIEEECKSLIKQANLICIFGSSIGETDNLWWSLILDEVVKRYNGCLVIVFEKCQDIPLRRGYKKGRITRKSKNLFFQRTTLNEDEKALFADNIIWTLNSNIFKIS